MTEALVHSLAASIHPNDRQDYAQEFRIALWQGKRHPKYRKLDLLDGRAYTGQPMAGARPHITPLEALPEALTPSGDLDLTLDILKAVAALPERQRRFVFHYAWGGLGIKAAAKAAGCHRDTWYSHIIPALKVSLKGYESAA
jgi:DNA-directed RNA polymerase specialized sigma24 family protein